MNIYSARPVLHSLHCRREMDIKALKKKNLAPKTPSTIFLQEPHPVTKSVRSKHRRHAHVLVHIGSYISLTNYCCCDSCNHATILIPLLKLLFHYVYIFLRVLLFRRSIGSINMCTRTNIYSGTPLPFQLIGSYFNNLFFLESERHERKTSNMRELSG